jgi:hypothetical protein
MAKSTPWLAHVKNTYKLGKSKNKNYKLGQAMKDAKKTYKKGGKIEEKEFSQNQNQNQKQNQSGGGKKKSVRKTRRSNK